MPAGVTWGQYLKFMAGALVSMSLGAQSVHLIYRPLEDLEVYVRREIETQNLKIDAKDVLKRQRMKLDPNIVNVIEKK